MKESHRIIVHTAENKKQISKKPIKIQCPDILHIIHMLTKK